MSAIFDQILYIPLFNFLVFLYNTIAFQDFGMAIIFLTILIRLILSPLSVKSLYSQKKLTELQPKIKELQEKYKGNKQALAGETMKMYKENNVNPLSGCLPLIIQIPFLLALYRISAHSFDSSKINQVYSFIARPEVLHSISFGFIDLTKKNAYLAVLAGVIQFGHSKLVAKSQQAGQASGAKTNPADMMAMMSKQMTYVFPIMTVFISFSFPAGLPLYWITTTVFSIFEHIYINKFFNKK